MRKCMLAVLTMYALSKHPLVLAPFSPFWRDLLSCCGDKRNCVVHFPTQLGWKCDWHWQHGGSRTHSWWSAIRGICTAVWPAQTQACKPDGSGHVWVSGLTGPREEDRVLRGQEKWVLFNSMPGALVRGSRECGLFRRNSAITGGEATGTQ